MLDPFDDDVYSPVRTPMPGVPDIHGEAFGHCLRCLEALVRQDVTHGRPGAGAGGRVVLVTSGRAGYGKSHLIGRLRGVAGNLVSLVPLTFPVEENISWARLLKDAVSHYRATSCPHYDCDLLDEVGRAFFAELTLAAVSVGEVRPSELPVTAEEIQNDFRKLFDPLRATSELAWLEVRYGRLIDRVGTRLSRRLAMDFADLKRWAEHLLAYAGSIPEAVGRREEAAACMLWESTPDRARERFGQFFRLATLRRPVAFVADHLDGLHGQECAGMEIANVLTSLQKEVPRSVVLLCVNDDVWRSVFAGVLPSALEDRLTADPVLLQQISVADAQHLVWSRMAAAGVASETAHRFVNELSQGLGWYGTGGEGLYPREVIRQARRFWKQRKTPAAEFPGQEMNVSSAPAPPVDEAMPSTQSPQSVPAPDAGAASDFDTAFPQTEEPVTAPAERPAEPAPRLRPRSAPLSLADSSSPHMTDLDSIIKEIRKGGLSVSEINRGAGVTAPVAATASAATSGGVNGYHTSRAGRPAPSAEAVRFEEILEEYEHRAGVIPWAPDRLRRLVEAVGDHYGAVQQSRLELGLALAGDQKTASHAAASLVRWRVRDQAILIGFAPLAETGYWERSLEETAALEDESPRKGAIKLVAWVHPNEQSQAASWEARMRELDEASAQALVDTIELHPSDLATLYAAEEFLQASRGPGYSAAVEVVARRLDPFWRRLARPR